jgi:surface carbohydrate biosynthesis protein (TIGR04326 family)
LGNHIDIWDTDSLPQPGDGQLLLWRSYCKGSSKNAVSIPALVEEHSNFLRARYLSWVYDLGEAVFSGKRVVDHLEIRPNFSFWWMTLISSKCNYSGSPQITQAIRLMAFDLWASENKVDSITLSGSDDALSECLDIWSKKRGVKYEYERQETSDRLELNARRISSHLPNSLKAILCMFRYFWINWPFRAAGLSEWSDSRADVTFFSYFSNLEPDNQQQDRFRSKFWTRLPDELAKIHCKTNWLHIFFADSSHPTPKHGKIKVDRFNEMGLGEQVHTVLEAFLSWSVAVSTLKDWFGMSKFATMLEPTLQSTNSDGLNLWPLYQKEWFSSLCGAPSIMKILQLNLFESAVKALPKQTIGVYLYEQQSWELALINSWRKENHGKLIGAQHTTMIFWDLRYYHDPRSYEGNSPRCLPMPDLIAANSTLSLAALGNSGYPLENILNVEALRYLHLSGITSAPKNIINFQTNSSVLRILVVGDYLASNNKMQMDLLSKAMMCSKLNVSITFKPHYACLVAPSSYPELDIKVTENSLESLFGDCDLVYSGPATSAAVDAYCSGVSVITALDENALNLSPLRNCTDVYFISTPLELSKALLSVNSADSKVRVKRDFFILDSDLPRWKELLLER